MKVKVELNMFMPGTIRVVNVPREKLRNKSLFQQLDQVFYYGQNDFQPMELPSVSMGDVIRYQGERYLILSVGFKKLKPDELVLTKPKLEDVFSFTKTTEPENTK